LTIFVAIKTFTQGEGLSCCFRQWRAEGSAAKLHGYSLEFKLVFECQQLDESDRTIDLDGFADISSWLRQQFGNTLVVAQDDPHLNTFRVIEAHGLCDLRVLPGTGCERFAEHVFYYVQGWMLERRLSPRVIIRSVECTADDGNGALCIGPH
jgi:6-pyruvoyltetrahydropterin/6-carboxytetrahydropterin synthase